MTLLTDGVDEQAAARTLEKFLLTKHRWEAALLFHSTLLFLIKS